MFDALSLFLEGNSINWKMTLRTQLKNVKMQNLETIQSCKGISIKEHIEEIGETVGEYEIVMTTLNGILRSWESFIQEICSTRKLENFNRLWEECTQEEAKLVVREEALGHDEDQALATRARKGKINK